MKKPNARELALRDPALAALMGIELGADFGAEFGDDDDDYGADDVDVGDDDDDYGAEFGHGGSLARARPPSSAQLQHMWHQRRVKAMAAQRRVRLLDPNRGSGIKIEKYILSLSQVLTIGTAVGISMTASPDCTFRPQRLTIVVPTPSFVTVNDIKMANVSVNVGPNAFDAFQFNANGVGQRLDLPTLTPANRALITGNYTGFAGGFAAATSFLLSATFIGPSSLAGGAAI